MQVSIILTCYNRERWVARAIRSAIAQKFPKNEFEVIVVDDGSTDHSREIIDNFSDSIVKIYHDENRGLPAARNSGIKRAKGRYVMHLDSDDYISEDNAVRVIDVFVDDLDLSGLGFKTVAEATGRPGYHPAVMLKLYIYGYLNRIQSSRRLEREANRNVELMWLLGRLTPDFKTIADFRKNNGEAIRLVCREFVMLCRKLELFNEKPKNCQGKDF